MNMGRPGSIALPVLLFLGAVTGYLTYDWMVVKATPIEGNYDNSPYRKEISSAQTQDALSSENTASVLPSEEEETSSANDTSIDGEQQSTEEDSAVVTISILQGSSVSGAPDYDTDHTTVPVSASIKWVNEDSVLHSATSGTGPSDDDLGSAFDTGLLTGGKEYTIAASEIGAGEYTYFCIAHPFMVGTLTIE